MSALNNASIIGRMAQTPELKETANGNLVCNFCVGVPDSKDKTDFIDCVAFKHTAEFVSKYFTQGKWIAVNGKINTRKFKDKNGNDRKAVEVWANDVGFVGGREKSESEGGLLDVEVNEDDLPF